jgi:hypothetical protein
MIAGAVTVGLLVLTVGLFVASRALYRQSFDRLVAATRIAEGDGVWVDYFVAEDCLFDTLVEQGVPEVAHRDAVKVLEQSDLLAAHVRSSLTVFASLSFLPTQGALSVARDGISAHYQAWDDHLTSVLPILTGLSADRGMLENSIRAWIEAVAGASEEIETTFETAEAAFVAAARDDPARLEVDTLFTASDAQCSRGAV